MDQGFTLLDDLRRTVEYMEMNDVKIIFHTRQENNGVVWEIRGPKTSLTILLHYQTESTQAINGINAISIKQEPSANLMYHQTDMDVQHEDAFELVSYLFDSRQQPVKENFVKLTIDNKIDGDEAVPVLNTVYPINENASEIINYSQNINSEPAQEIKPQVTIPFAVPFDSDCEGKLEDNLNHDTLPCFSNTNTLPCVSASLVLQECKTYINLNREIPIIEEDAIEAKPMQLLENNAIIEHGSSNKVKIELRTEHHDANSLDPSFIDEKERMKIKNCTVLLQSIKLPIPAEVQEQEKGPVTKEVESDEKNCSPRRYPLRSTFQSTERPIKCPVIDKTPIRKRRLEPDEVCRSGEKLYKCSHCDEKFSRQGSLYYHKQTHNEEKPYHCSQCDKKFSSTSSFRYHKLIHSGEMGYACPQCKRKFRQKANLEQHILTHSEEKRYKCPECDMSFRQHSSLYKHNLFHSGEKPFECLTCKKTFSRKENLKQHQAVHSKKKPFKCSTCNKKWRFKCQWKQHLLTHAEEND